MKSLPLFFIFLILVISPGCDRTSFPPSLWHSANADADSLMLVLDSNLRAQPYFHVLQTIAEELDSIASAGGDSQVKARALYCKSRIHRDRGLDSLAYAETLQALELADSAAYPYEFARFSELFFPRLYPSSVSQILKLHDNLSVFSEAADSFKISETLNKMAVVYRLYADYATAAKLYTEARQFLSPDDHKRQFLNDYNRVLLYKEENMADSVRDIFRRLLRNPYRVRRAKSNTLIMVANYELDGDERLLHEAYSVAAQLVKEEPEQEKRMYPARHLMNIYLDRGMMDSAAMYAGVLRTTMAKIQLEDSIMPASLRDYYLRIGKSDSASRYAVMATDVKENLSIVRKANQLQKMKYHEELSSLNEILANEQQEDKFQRLGIFLLVVAVAVLGICLCIVRSRRSRHNWERLQMEESLEEKKRHLALAEMKIAETAGDWNRFEMLYAEVRPNFIRNLCGKHPGLTPGEVRLACLVSLGVETKDIARMMSINPDSVKKNRQRLRAKLGIDSSVALDAYLRQFD